MSGSFEQAVETARANIPIQQMVARPEYWSDYTIVRVGDSHRVYKSSAWSPPSEAPLLPWSPPKGVRVATVSLDGAVTLLAASGGSPIA